MPFEKISELPDQVKNTLPKHGIDIYGATNNNAWEEYKKPADRKNND